MLFKSTRYNQSINQWNTCRKFVTNINGKLLNLFPLLELQPDTFLEHPPPSLPSFSSFLWRGRTGSVLFIKYCVSCSLLLFVCILYTVLPVSLDCPFWAIAPSVFSNRHLFKILYVDINKYNIFKRWHLFCYVHYC